MNGSCKFNCAGLKKSTLGINVKGIPWSFWPMLVWVGTLYLYPVYAHEGNAPRNAVLRQQKQSRSSTLKGYTHFWWEKLNVIVLLQKHGVTLRPQTLRNSEKRMMTHKWTDGLMKGSAQDVTEDQKSQPLTFLQTVDQNVKEVVSNASLSLSLLMQPIKWPTLWSHAGSPCANVCSPDVLSFSQSYSTSGCTTSLHRLHTQSPLNRMRNSIKLTKTAANKHFDRRRVADVECGIYISGYSIR